MDAGDYDVIVLEPIAHAYSQIKRIAPNLIILCLSFDDPEAFQVLSMLHMDGDTARIPLLTYTATNSTDFQDDSVDVEDDMFQRTGQLSRNPFITCHN
jgi:DNA-binding response OmpR family regulator